LDGRSNKGAAGHSVFPTPGPTTRSFRSQLSDLDQVNWQAVAARDFRAAEIKEGKQAEFLVRDSFPWRLVQRIGVFTPTVAQQVADAIRHAAHRPVIEIRPDWYFLNKWVHP
jgi:ssDNA thymidine ADP-ribosyltransferase, DarT